MIPLALAAALAGCQTDGGQPLTTSSAEERMYMREFGSALPPLGYVGFCRRTPDECALDTAGNGEVELTPAMWETLNAVNSYANHAVRPATDQEVYGHLEYWAMPKSAGDCEDYVLLKRKMLVAEGWPASALLITVVRDENQEGHAVLTVDTDMGDLILDNKTDLIRPFADTPYIFYKRQSRTDETTWVALMPDAQSDRAIAATRTWSR